MVTVPTKETTADDVSVVAAPGASFRGRNDTFKQVETMSCQIAYSQIIYDNSSPFGTEHSVDNMQTVDESEAI